MGNSCRTSFCHTHNNFLPWCRIFKQFSLARAWFARKAVRFHRDDLLRHPVDFGRWFAWSICGSSIGLAMRIDPYGVGYTQSLHDDRAWFDGGVIRGGKSSTLSHAYIWGVASAISERVVFNGYPCRVVCIGRILYGFDLCNRIRAFGLFVEQCRRGKSGIWGRDAVSRSGGASHCDCLSITLGWDWFTATFTCWKKYRDT